MTLTQQKQNGGRIRPISKLPQALMLLGAFFCFGLSAQADDLFPSLDNFGQFQPPRSRPLTDGRAPRFEERLPSRFDEFNTLDRRRPTQVDYLNDHENCPIGDHSLSTDSRSRDLLDRRPDDRSRYDLTDLRDRLRDRSAPDFRDRNKDQYDDRNYGREFDRTPTRPTRDLGSRDLGSQVRDIDDLSNRLRELLRSEQLGRPVSNDMFPLQGGSRFQGNRLDRDDFNRPTINPRNDRFQPAPRRETRPAPTAQRPESLEQQIQKRLTYRYQDPATLRFLQSVPFNSAVSMYQEISQLLDARHLQPKSYNDRAARALQNLSYALNNPTFTQANRLSASRDRAAAFATYAQQMLSQKSVRDARETASLINTAANVAQREFGISPTVVAMEFAYGALEAHDKYSMLVPTDPRTGPSASAVDDHVVGIGVEIKPTDAGLTIQRVLTDGPAAKAGLKKGDVILAVNGQRLNGRTVTKAADLITGRAGTQVSLTVTRGDQTGNVSMTRSRVEIMTVNDVQFLDRESGVGYFKLDKFGAKSADEVDRALWALHRQGMKSLVMDLRGNPGGLLTAAVEISNKFVPCGTIVSTRGRLASDNMKETADHEQTWNMPLVVLVDGNSASASEIFAAAVQENQRGLVVGENSYGKGTVQTHFPLRSVSGSVRITTAKFYSPKDREMAGAGVAPDIRVSLKTAGDSAERVEREVLNTALRISQSERVQTLAANSCSHIQPAGFDSLRRQMQDAGQIRFPNGLAGSR